ncbi:N-acetylglucosamine-6-phosphate deacetylase [Pediococcus acidilactici]|uniref:N-acetylglucosamine-6-phosphate deacetylase n=1 Tax=Pediococcus acidilactici TaxID=1254 RepID=UPI00132586BD|nr:N-acetylglucosamine-6-phosphate deacetylase [Pediococcus acidilactici]KAF0334474.1 N-acetylglucosamine-6-phosphate deacetylase [Pediococcus acidilactici]KAF0347814.1 N-acetylglucosamine-6-phosphate deacetylase [Pediococcus acidilactici]KAF0393879.1 N-acetylglucosamine-6-phosphate deacetylase [Pediococcus acidilactici]KAF0398102.1 N-acetylglucosamine-6-phosphate deacetylase [Pediococcus acidilactici]KAF0410258.1 N-acetylglucosamine-6-phosphate deacetylase [Pediococcus acidilactici]
MEYYIHAAKFFLGSNVEMGGYLPVIDGKFGRYQKEKPTGKIVDYGDQWIAPGLVDTHVHGLLNHDVMDADAEGINAMSKGLLECGVTSWLPTTLTASSDQLKQVVQTISDHVDDFEGAKVQGIHFEGPYYTEKHKGAQNPKYFENPSVDEFHAWQSAAQGMIRKISIAPERDGAVEFTAKISSEGVVVALGHSDATFDQAKACVEAGATMFTHTFNGMSGLNHREPGMAGAAMSLDGVTDELICDGHHVNPYVVKILMQTKTYQNVALVTDCMKAGLMPDGDYILGEFPVKVANGTARLTDGSNSLAGSILLLKDAVKNVVDWNVATPEQAITMASANAADSAGVGDQCGHILPGRDADFIVLDHELNLNKTYLDGVKVFG